MLKKLTYTILLVLTGSIGFAQLPKIAFEKYGVEEGLPEEFVRDLLQDDKGFIWFGTQNGLVKYDGYSFKVYRATLDKTDTTSLQLRNLGGGLLKARDGKIWLGESSGYGRIASFDPHTEKFRNYYLSGNTNETSDRIASVLTFEDEEGNIWFRNGSYMAGVTGQFTTFRLNPATGVIKEYPLGDITGGNPYLSGNAVESSGNIWILDDKNNLNKWNRQNDSFEIIIPAGKDLSTSSATTDTIRQLNKGADNRLLLTGRHGLYIFDAKTQKIVKNYVHKRGDASSIADSVFRADEDVKGQIWVTHAGGKLSLIDPATDNVETFTYGSGPLYFAKGPQKIDIFFGHYQNKDGIWFQALTRGTDFGIKFFVHYRFDTKTFSIYDYNFNLATNPFLKDRIPYRFLEDRTGLLWLSTRPGLYKQSPKKQQMDLFRYRANEPNGLPSDSIRYLFEDSKKRLWIGTGNGLALYQPDQDNFRVFRNEPSKTTSLSNNEVTTVQEDADEKIWVGTANGLNQWQESTGRFKRFFYKTGETNNIEFLFTDQQQRLWLSIWDKGVFVLDKKTGRVIKSYLPDDKNSSSLTSKQIEVFYQDSRGNIWLGDESDNKFGLYRLNQAEDGFTHYLPIPGDSSSISSNEILFLAEDGKQRLWIGTDGGLNLYDYPKNRFTRYRNVNISSVPQFAIDKKGEPWFSTYSGGGLVSVDAEKGIITAYGESEGLLQNDLSSSGLNSEIAKDEFDQFWLPTQRGLSVFDPENKTFISYFEKDGFQPYTRRYSTLKTSNGDIWIGSNHGLNHIVPANLLKKDTTLPSIVITQVTINDSLYSKPDGAIFKKSVAYTGDFKLEYWQKDLSFDFVALHYLRSEDNQYSWKLENYDKDWSAPSKERKASYTNLSPGKYIFRVKASNADGVWNEEGIAITITILPPWWLTWWAYTIYVLLFLGALRVFSKWRERRLRHEKENLQIKVEERTSELKESLEHLKSTQSQLIQSEKMASLGELTAGIAHEIQNPLNFVNNFSELNKELIDELEEEIEKGDKEGTKAILKGIRENEEKVMHHGKRAEGIVKSMLQHSRSSSGEKELTDLNALADEYLRLAYHGFRAKDNAFNADIKTDFDPDLPKVSVVPQEMGRVLLNLINNAFQAVSAEALAKADSDYKPEVIVSTKMQADKIEIRVSDNGPGIPDNIKEKIFQPFFTTKPTGQGTGLGLSLSYDIVKAHGGELKVETLGTKGEGQPAGQARSEFIIKLPVV